MKRVAKKRPMRATFRRTLRALGGRRLTVERFGPGPVYVTITGGSDVPVGAWVAPSQLRRLADVARRIGR